MPTGIVTTRGYSLENLAGMYPNMESLNYAQNLTSVPPTFINGRYQSPLDPLMESFRNKFGMNPIHFNKSFTKGTIRGIRYEVFTNKNNKKIVIGNKVFTLGKSVGDGFTIKNIGKKQVILIHKNNNITKRLYFSQFVDKMI
jgi:hypothetical protein